MGKTIHADVYKDISITERKNKRTMRKKDIEDQALQVENI